MFFWSGVVGFGLGDLALYQALPRLGSRLTLLLVHCVAAPSAAFAEWLWLGTTLTPPQIASIACILLGVAVALWPLNGESTAKHFDLVGVAYGLVAAIGQGVYKRYLMGAMGESHEVDLEKQKAGVARRAEAALALLES